MAKPLTQSCEVKAPVSGRVLALTKVADAAFSTGALGKGAAVVPEQGEIVSPVNGRVEVVYETKHAIGLVTDDGMELLIHIGMDTVNLGGKYFTAHVKDGDLVKEGQKLVSFDLEALQKEGYDVTTPVVVTNGAEYLDVIETTQERVEAGEVLVTAVR